MQKVYLLLRGNQQNGPYSLDELLQFDLKPVDLIWIEGKSAGWYYPQEIKELLPHLPFVKSTVTEAPLYINQKEQSPASPSPKKIFVSMPPKVEEQASLKAVMNKETSSIKQTATQTQALPSIDNETKTTYPRSIDDVGSDYTNWVYNQKTKKKKEAVRKKVSITAIVIAAGLMVFAAINRFSSSSEEPVQQDKIAAIPATDSTTTTNESSAIRPVSQTLNSKKRLPKIKSAGTVKKITNRVASSSSTPLVTKAGIETVNKEEVKPATKIIEEKPVVPKEEKAVEAEAPKEKKKMLKEKILDLFKKKETPTKEEAKGVEVEDGERRSVHRQADANLVEQVHIKFTIPNDWMIGIKGAKVSVTNKSNQTIAKATIEVLYYNEDNELLQTKTVSFGKIEAKETGTISIPDHSFADHVEYKIVSVQGAGEPFARM